MVARRATLYFPKRDTKCREEKKRQGKKQKPRDSFEADRTILVTETEEDFLHAESKRNQFKCKTKAGQPVARTTMENILREKRYLPQDNGQMSKKN